MEVFCEHVEKEWPRTCFIEVESYGFSDTDIRYSWGLSETNAVKHVEEGFLTHEYKMVSLTLFETTMELNNGNYSRLRVEVIVDKN